MNKQKATILVVDDEESVRNAVIESLSKEGYDVTGSSSAPDAMIKVLQMRFDIAILDILMPDISGFELITVFNKLCPDTSVIVVSGILDPAEHFASTAVSSGVFAFLKKPCKLQELKDSVKKALARKEVFC